jgi:hypothetical protein
MRMYLILDSGDNIVGAVSADIQEVRTLPKTDEESEEVATLEVQAIPQPGQTIYEVELPRELEQLNGVELQQSLMRYEVKPRQVAVEAELVLRDSYGS